MRKWGHNVLEMEHEGKGEVVRKNLWGAGMWPEAQMKRRSQQGQELGGDGPRGGQSTLRSSPGWGQAMGVQK